MKVRGGPRMSGETVICHEGKKETKSRMKRLLIVEDQPDIREAYRMLLDEYIRSHSTNFGLSRYRQLKRKGVS